VVAEARRFALGVGLTNACNLGCKHCYRAVGSDQLDVSEVLRAVEALPTRAVNFGTGESGLHPEFARLVRELLDRGIAVTMTTNGLSAEALDDRTLARLRDVEFSVDYPTEAEHDAARGPGNWKLIEAQMERCRALGVSATLVSVLMSTNWHLLPELARLAASRGAYLRVNVYQAVRGDRFAPSYDEFWGGWRALLGEAKLVVCGEPIVRAVLGIERAPGAGCGVETVRITPRGAVVPCVYGGDQTLGVEDLVRLGAGVVDEETFRALRGVPDACRACPAVATCAGGCPSRRILRGGLDRPDEYCPFVRGEAITLPLERAPEVRDMPKAASACTTIVRGR
jgi:radical SAM protein with 4Fe4S-binding SPASM domain